MLEACAPVSTSAGRHPGPSVNVGDRLSAGPVVWGQDLSYSVTVSMARMKAEDHAHYMCSWP